MTVVDPGSEIRVLTRKQCLDLVADEEVGRIAVVLGRQPLVFPVNFVLDGETVVFRSDAGTKLAAASFEHVAFEVDRIDHRRREGWSVLIQGVGHDVTPEFSRTFERVRALAITPWAPGDKEHWVRVLPNVISGRRLVAREPSKG